MAARNATGSSLYARPAHSLESHSWILVDGLNEASLAKLDELTPAGVVVETSPGSLQAWVRTKPSQDEHTRTAIGRYLARTVGAANPEAAEGSAFGRIPGATNRKPALQRPDKLFPFTALRRAAPHEFTEYRALEGKLEPSDWPEPVALATERPTSRPADTKRDFAVACRLVESESFALRDRRGTSSHPELRPWRTCRIHPQDDRSGPRTRGHGAELRACRRAGATGTRESAEETSAARGGGANARERGAGDARRTREGGACRDEAAQAYDPQEHSEHHARRPVISHRGEKRRMKIARAARFRFHPVGRVYAPASPARSAGTPRTAT